MKILSPRVHGYLDYMVVLLMALAPILFGFGGIVAALCYGLALAQLGMSLLTAYPLSLSKTIPFTVHGWIEAVVALLLLAAPWMFAFANDLAARNFFLISGVGLALVWLVTDYKAADHEYGDAPMHTSGRHSVA